MITKMSAGLYRFCDASHWQGDMDWTKAAARLDFAYAKTSQGIITDSQWIANVDGCAAIGFPLGGYMYHDTTIPWKRQVDYFLELYYFSAVPLIPVVDLEMVRPAPKVADILNILADIMAELQVFPIIYSAPSYIMQYLTLPDFAQFPLMIAHYATQKNWPLAAPRVPLPWFAMDWWGWQLSADGNGQGKYYGAQSTAIDLNVAWSIPWMVTP
jgi:GH25 family lysozyme M1 (1,4-beta-N-acetylmuramidase)